MSPTSRSPWDQLSPMARALINVPWGPEPGQLLSHYVWDEAAGAWSDERYYRLKAAGDLPEGAIVVTFDKALLRWFLTDHRCIPVLHRTDGGPAVVPLGPTSGPKWYVDGENILLDWEVLERARQWDEATDTYERELKARSFCPSTRSLRMRA